jgi:hypothetical protein
MELAGLEPAMSSVRFRRASASISSYFQGFCNQQQPLPVTSYRRITRRFSAIWSQVLRPGTRSIIDRGRLDSNRRPETIAIVRRRRPRLAAGRN